MTDEMFDGLISKLGKVGKLCLYLQNEPFLDRDILKRVKKCVDSVDFKSLELSTNARMVTRADVQELETMLDGVKHEIRVSFHGCDRETYEYNMGLEFETSLGKTMMLLNSNLNVSVWSAYAPRFQRYDVGKAFARDAVKALFEGHKVHTFTYHDRARYGSGKPKKCVRQTDWLHVLYDGTVILCCMDYNKETVLGHVQDLAGALSNRRPMAICGRCESPGG